MWPIQLALCLIEPLVAFPAQLAQHSPHELSHTAHTPNERASQEGGFPGVYPALLLHILTMLHTDNKYAPMGIYTQLQVPCTRHNITLYIPDHTEHKIPFPQSLSFIGHFAGFSCFCFTLQMSPPTTKRAGQN